MVVPEPDKNGVKGGLIIKYIEQWGKAQKKDIKNLLWDKLPDGLSDSQKNSKIKNLMYSMAKEGIIETDSDNKRLANWILKK